MAQHVTTLNEIREGMSPTDTPSNTDLVYCERGSGSDRARAFQVDEIAAKATESLGNDGDIEFSQYQAAGGVTRTKGLIQAGKILGTMFASVVNLVGKTIRWVNGDFGTTELVWNGLRFFKNDPDVSSPDYRFDNDGNVKLGKLIFSFNHLTLQDTRYEKMTSCESAVGAANRSKLTEYITKAATNRPDFWLDSEAHEEGTAVLVANYGQSTIYCVPAWFSGSDYEGGAVCVIRPNSSKMVVYRGKVTQGNVQYPVWTSL